MALARNYNRQMAVPFSSIDEPINTLFSMGFQPKYTELKSYESWHLKGAHSYPAGFYKVNDETMMLITYDRLGAKSNVRFFRIPNYNNIMQYKDKNELEIPGNLLWRQLNMKDTGGSRKSKFLSKKFVKQASREYQEAVTKAFIMPTQEWQNNSNYQPNHCYPQNGSNQGSQNLEQAPSLFKNMHRVVNDKIYSNHNVSKVERLIQKMTATNKKTSQNDKTQSAVISTVGQKSTKSDKKSKVSKVQKPSKKRKGERSEYNQVF